MRRLIFWFFEKDVACIFGFLSKNNLYDDCLEAVLQDINDFPLRRGPL